MGLHQSGLHDLGIFERFGVAARLGLWVKLDVGSWGWGPLGLERLGLEMLAVLVVVQSALLRWFHE